MVKTLLWFIFPHIRRGAVKIFKKRKLLGIREKVFME